MGGKIQGHRQGRAQATYFTRGLRFRAPLGLALVVPSRSSTMGERAIKIIWNKWCTTEDITEFLRRFFLPLADVPMIDSTSRS